MVFNSKEAALAISASLVPVFFGSGVLHPPKHRHMENIIIPTSEYFIFCSIKLLLGRGACLELLVTPAHCAVNERVRGEQGNHQRLHAAIVIGICLMGFL